MAWKLIGALLLAPACIANTIVLYDGSVSGLPETQGYLTFGNLFGGTETTQPGYTRLSTSNAAYAGYSTAGFPILDRSTGFTVSFRTELEDETLGANTSRAGLSVIVLGSDKMGIEIGFQQGNIFAQGDNPLFVAAESVSTQQTRVFATYDLSIFGNVYTLSSGGNQLLTGPVRDYSALTGFGSQVYQTPNFIFLGDDTTSAGATTDFSLLTVTTAAPEPATLFAGFLTLAFVWKRWNGLPR